MSILSRLTYSLEVKLNILFQAFEFERRLEDPELQVDALLETSSAKIKTENRNAIGHLVHTLKFMMQLGTPFRGHRNSGRLEPASDIKDMDTSTGNFRATLHFHSTRNSELATHLKESPFIATYFSPDIQNELITQIEEISPSISFEVKAASCFAVIADETPINR